MPVEFNSETVDLIICGEGSTCNKDFLREMLGTMPPTPKIMYLDNPVRLSVDHILMDKFLVWSTTEKMFFITNMTKDRVIGYSWEK